MKKLTITIFCIISSFFCHNHLQAQLYINNAGYQSITNGNTDYVGIRTSTPAAPLEIKEVAGTTGGSQCVGCTTLLQLTMLSYALNQLQPLV